MNIGLVLVIAVAIILIVLALKVLHGLFKIAFSIAGILVIALLLIIGMTYLDAKKMKGLLEEGDTIVLYEQDDVLLSGIRLQEGGLSLSSDALSEDLDILNKTHLATYEQNIEENTITENELIFIITNETFQNITNISFSDYVLPKETIDAVLQSDTPKEVLVDFIQEKEQLTKLEISYVEEEFASITNREIKTTIFLLLFSKFIETQGEQAILKEIKEEHIHIKPDFFTLTLLDYLPDNIFDKALNKTMNATAINKTEN